MQIAMIGWTSRAMFYPIKKQAIEMSDEKVNHGGRAGRSRNPCRASGRFQGGRLGDVKALIGIYNATATATDSAISANSGVDVRQAYFSFGNDGMGTIKLGRDNGSFGAGAIFGDMTLIGAGAPVQATQRGRVTLGHIGAGAPGAASPGAVQRNS